MVSLFYYTLHLLSETIVSKSFHQTISHHDLEVIEANEKSVSTWGGIRQSGSVLEED